MRNPKICFYFCRKSKLAELKAELNFKRGIIKIIIGTITSLLILSMKREKFEMMNLLNQK